jgi:hypothetical protein
LLPNAFAFSKKKQTAFAFTGMAQTNADEIFEL